MKALRSLIVLAFLGAAAASAQQEAAVQDTSVRQIEVTVLGMSCPFCAYGLQQKLKKLDGVTELEVVLETGLATLQMEDDADIANEVLQKAVKDAGFEVAKIERTFTSDYPNFDRNATE